MSGHRKPAKSPGDYPVGYRRPPVESRFQPGKSGNPRGRRAGLKSLGKLLADALARRVTIQENGRQRTMRMRDVIIQGLVNDAARRDPRALKQLFALMDRYGDGHERESDIETLLSNDREIIETFLTSMKEHQLVAEPMPPEDELQKSGDPPAAETAPPKVHRND